MNEPMDIDLSLDEIIAKKNQERVSKRSESRHNPYNRPASIPTGPKRSNPATRPNNTLLNRGKTLRNTLSFADMKSKYNNNPFSDAPLLPTSDNLKRPCRELSVGVFSKDITPLQIRDLIQFTVGPVQELSLDSGGVAWIRMLRWQGWEVYTFLNGKVLDGAKQLQVRVYPLRSLPKGSQGLSGRRRRKSG